MSTNLRLVDGRTVAVRESVSEVSDVIKRFDPSRDGGFYEFRTAAYTEEVRRIRVSAIIEYGQGHSK